MNNQSFIDSLNKIDPDEFKKQRIWNRITANPGKRRVRINYRIAVPVLSLVLVIAAGAVSYSIVNNGARNNFLAGEVDDLVSKEDGALLVNQFELGNRQYVRLSDDLRKGYGFSDAVTEDQIGNKLETIQNTSDESLKGKDVYSYIPADCEAVVAVKNDTGKYDLFGFSVFASYENNQDEDASAYLGLYGIKSADDIAKIQFIGTSEQAKLENRASVTAEITDRTDIGRFYGFYSVLKNASDDYFMKLFGSMPQSGSTSSSGAVDAAPDYASQSSAENDVSAYVASSPSTVYTESGAASDAVDAFVPGSSSASAGSASSASASAGSVSGSAGVTGDAFANQQTIRIYNKNGIYFETWYYPNIGFISRYAVSPDFAEFLSQYIK